MNEDLVKCYGKAENLIKQIDKILRTDGLSNTEKMELLTSASDGIRDKAIEIDCRDD